MKLGGEPTLFVAPSTGRRPAASGRRGVPRPGDQLALDLGPDGAQDEQRGRGAPAERADGQSGAVEHRTPQNGAYAAAALAVATCATCDGELSAGDVRQSQYRCSACRRQRSLEQTAERDAPRAPRAPRCRCLRWSITENGDGPRRCIKCSREV